MRTYNPLTVEELGRNAARALMDYPAAPLPPQPFDGVGVYTLHYRGEFEAYADMGDAPIYVGKADRAGQRVLYGRLADHAQSIDQAENLLLRDFECRWLVLEAVWIGLTEQVLIAEYEPVWNVVVTGFGNHDPGSGRAQQRRSQWDALHPGRPWAARLRESADDRPAILTAIRQHRMRADD